MLHNTLSLLSTCRSGKNCGGSTKLLRCLAMQMLQMVAERGGLPRSVLTQALARGTSQALDNAIKTLRWDDITRMADPNSLETWDKVAKVHPPEWQKGKANVCLAACTYVILAFQCV